MFGNIGYSGFITKGGGSGPPPPGSGVSNISITSANFEADGITYLNDLIVDDNVSLFWSDLPNFLYISKGQWQYVAGGLKILIPDFDANSFDYNLEILLKVIDL